MFIPTLTLLEPSEEQMCPHGDYPTEKGICCNRCSPGTVWPSAQCAGFNAQAETSSSTVTSILQSSCVYMWRPCLPGFKLVEKCNATGQRSTCTPCPAGQYTDQMNFFPNCLSCRRCKGTATWPSCSGQRGVRLWFALSTFSTSLQHRSMKWRYHHVKDRKTQCVTVRPVITSLTSTRKHTSVTDVHNVDRTRKRKRKHVSLNTW